MASDQKCEIVFAVVEQMGHLMPVLPFMKELHQRGHLITCFLPEDPKYRGKLREFGLGEVEAVPVAFPNMGAGMKNPFKHKGGPLGNLSRPLFPAITEHYMNTGTKPAIVVAEFFSVAAHDAADALGVPSIIVFPNPLGMLPLANPWQRGLFEILKASCARVLEAIAARIVLRLRNQDRRDRSLPPMIEQDVYPCDTMRRPCITTWGLGYEYPFLQSPLLNYVGPSEPASFPAIGGDLLQWFDEQTKPIVYVAFGTMHKFTPKSCNQLLGELRKVQGAAILWSLPEVQQKMLEVDRSGVHFESFVPQYAVLKHPKVIAFVTHCGANSVSEAILSGTPLVCCPTGKDQPANACRVISARVGVLSKGDVNGVGAALRIVLDDISGFKMRVQKLRKILLSHGGARRGADIIESVADVGYEHLMPCIQRASWARLLAVAACCYALFRARRMGPRKVGVRT